MADTRAGSAPRVASQEVDLDWLNKSSRNDGFRRAMLKAALDTTPQVTEENYSVWKDKMSGLLELRGVLDALESPITQLSKDKNAELKLLLISKMNSQRKCGDRSRKDSRCQPL
ncbi:hypothetical protein VP01_12087g1 [Puccinia sorghi]|uniref:Uncharacterized protein n=1 Tax=Puccinia sorghi TaxID=27349 RepID=A0A0L6VQD9_9BASI|nr:hypothetical protein VP01_12087g1 [Puccinia sorghi]